MFRTCYNKMPVTLISACETHYTIPVYTTVFLKMDPRVRNT